MKTILGLAFIPLLCMGITILTALVIIFALRRGTKAINEQVGEVVSERQGETSGNTRWARGDLQGEPRAAINTPPAKTCPACGGENTAASSSCAFCGTKL